MPTATSSLDLIQCSNMKNLLEHARDELKLLLFILFLIWPYSLLFYKKISLRIRLLFISLIEILALCALSIIVDYGNGSFLDIVYSYELWACVSVILNIIVIFLSWLFKTIRLGNKPKQ
jgi:hypothetical protein